jgi:hypothetical protein
VTSARCDNCRFWTLLRSGAVIGRCDHADSQMAFPRAAHCCSLWEQDRRHIARPDSEQPGMPDGDQAIVQPQS